MKILFFITPTCTYCGPAKELVKASGIEGIEYIDATENKELAKSYGVRSVPSIVLSKPDRNQIFVGIDQIEEFIVKNKELKNCSCESCGL